MLEVCDTDKKEVTASVLTEQDFSKELPLVSVIVPVYKVEKYLSECVDSILKQTYKNLEIILVDDGSPDRCPQLCDEYAAQDSRVRVIHKENGGLSDARNAGIESAKGEWLCFVDSDDKLATASQIEKLIGFIKSKENAEIIYCPLVERFTDSDEKNINFKKLDLAEIKENSFSSLEIFNFAKKNHFIFAAWLFVVKTDFIKKHNLLFTKGLLHEDMDWIPRVLTVEQKSISVFTEPFYLYRFNPSSITSSFTQNRFDSIIFILKMLSDLLSQTSQPEFIKAWFNMNLYNLVIYLENDCLSKTDFYKSNIRCLKNVFSEISDCSEIDERVSSHSSHQFS